MSCLTVVQGGSLLGTETVVKLKLLGKTAVWLRNAALVA